MTAAFVSGNMEPDLLFLLQENEVDNAITKILDSNELHFDVSLQLVHKFIPMPQAMKIPDALAAMDKEWSSRQFQRGIRKSQEQKGGHLKIAELEPTFQKYKGRVVLRGVRWQFLLNRARLHPR